MFSIGIIGKNKSKKLTQWDADRYIEITASEGVEVSHVDFAYENDPKAIRREVTLSDGIMTAKVPNSLLQRCGKMRVWLVCDDVTVFGDNVVVAPKTRDEGYVLPDDEDDVYNYTNLEKRIEELEKGSGGISKEVFEKEMRKLSEDIAELNGVEITSGEPTKASTVMTLNPNAEEVNLYTAEEIDEMLQNLPSGGNAFRLLGEVNITEEVLEVVFDGFEVDDIYLLTVGLKTNKSSGSIGAFLEINDIKGDGSNRNKDILYSENVFNAITTQSGWLLMLDIGDGYKCAIRTTKQDIPNNIQTLNSFNGVANVQVGKITKVTVVSSELEYPFSGGILRLYGR